MTDIILRFIEGGGYLGIAFLMALENIIPPIPSEVIMGFAGIAVAHGRLNFALVLVAGTLGSTAGNYAWYALGKRLGIARLKPLVDRWGRWLTLEWRDVERAQGLFQRHGGIVVFLFRISPAFRTMISLPAGLAGMPRGSFLLATLIGTAGWNVVLIEAGVLLGRHFDRLERYTGPATIALLALAGLAWLYRVATWRPRG
jgi:membrane protein DedA with SNARE-associated domain